MKIGFYSNYNVDKQSIYVESGWECESSKIKTFLNQNDVRGGWGNEAVEIGLYHANKQLDAGLSQITVIGDMPANTEEEFISKMNRKGPAYWNKAFPGLTASAGQVQKIKAQGVPIHTMYLTESARSQFGQMSSQTGGKSHLLDVNDSNAAEMLTEVVSVTVLSDQGENFVQSYKNKYGIKFMHS